MVRYRRTEEFVRYCMTEYKNEAAEMVSETMEGTYGSGLRFKGPLNEPLTWINDAVFGNERFNFTFIIKKTFGRYNETSGWYDEESCLYQMQKNLTDAALLWARMPVLACDK